MSKPLKTFICYAREDRDAVDDLRKHLKQAERKQLLEIWDDGEIHAGQDWDKAIKVQLETAQLILFFVSIDFINSDYIETTELQAALQRHRDGAATLIPIIVRRCDWQEHFGIGKFQALPKEARPIKSVEISIREEIYYEVAQGIKAVAEELKTKFHLETERAATRAAEEDAKQQREKEEQARAKRQGIKDEAAWKTSVELDTLEAYEDYLDKKYTLHEAQAHERIGELEAADAKRRAELKAKEKAAAAKKAKEEEEKHQREEIEKKRLADLDDLAAKARRAKVTTVKGLTQMFDPFHDLMIPIKGGTFKLGGNHSVTLQDFHLCKYPVTQAQWKKILGDNPAHFKGDDLPVENVSWDDAQAFLKKLNAMLPPNGGQKPYRLPSEAEWEYAAKGGNQSKGFEYAGSNDLKEVGWYWENSGDKPLKGEWKSDVIMANNCKTHPVGQKKPNELGLYDMSGNVWEWCQDIWHDDYKGAPDDGTAWEQGGDSTRRVVRGGSWNSNPLYCRAAYRIRISSDYRYGISGFRLAR